MSNASAGSPPPRVTSPFPPTTTPTGFQDLTNQLLALNKNLGQLIQTMSTFVGNATQTIGTWTPTDNSGASLTFTSVSAGYTKIGNIVFAYFTLTMPSTVSGAQLSLAGLPFAIANQPYAGFVLANMARKTGSNAYSAIEVALVPNTNTVTTNTTNATASTEVVSGCIVYPVS